MSNILSFGVHLIRQLKLHTCIRLRYFQVPKRILQQLAGEEADDMAEEEEDEVPAAENAAPAARSLAAERSPKVSNDPLEAAAARLAERIAQSSAGGGGGGGGSDASEVSPEQATGAARPPDEWEVFNDMADEWYGAG